MSQIRRGEKIISADPRHTMVLAIVLAIILEERRMTIALPSLSTRQMIDEAH